MRVSKAHLVGQASRLTRRSATKADLSPSDPASFPSIKISGICVHPRSSAVKKIRVKAKSTAVKPSQAPKKNFRSRALGQQALSQTSLQARANLFQAIPPGVVQPVPTFSRFLISLFAPIRLASGKFFRDVTTTPFPVYILRA